jgi:hypothetical protein
MGHDGRKDNLEKDYNLAKAKKPCLGISPFHNWPMAKVSKMGY